MEVKTLGVSYLINYRGTDYIFGTMDEVQRFWGLVGNAEFPHNEAAILAQWVRDNK